MLRMGLVLLLVLSNLSACSPPASHRRVPIYDISTARPSRLLLSPFIHKVTADETLYSIAWRYGYDYQMLAKQNHIAPPYRIQTGQIIYLAPRAAPQPAKKLIVKKNGPPTLGKAVAPKHMFLLKPNLKVFPPSTTQEKPRALIARWQWPAQGPLHGTFSSFNKGINITGQQGDPIFATAAGKVVYSGNGLRSYGNLIIIKHNSHFLTAYAHNSKLLVKEGEWVNRGQKIAEMGNTGTQSVMLHFEIRRNGKPVNPLIYLARKI